MFAARLAIFALAALLVAQLAVAGPRQRRQLADDNTLQPLDDAGEGEQAREKRKLEGATQAKYGVKNAILGFVFGKINSLIDSKTKFIDNLDKQNIEINKQYMIEAPAAGGLSSLTGIIGQSGTTSKHLRRTAADTRTSDTHRTFNLQDTTSKDQRSSLTRSTSQLQDQNSSTNMRIKLAHDQNSSTNKRIPSNQATDIAYPSSSGISGTRGTAAAKRTPASNTRVSRQTSPRPNDDIPVFDRNKVSLDIPGSLFGPSVSLLIRTTKIIGDVVQNSAVRYQTFLRLFRPLFRGPFEIKGLDPPTTTPRTTTRRTTTTTTTGAPLAADNEIRRRRHL